MNQANKEVDCNLCGHSCKLTEGPGLGPVLGGLINQQVMGGYFSTAGNGYGALDDNDTYQFSLCEFCLDSLFSKFKIPVKCWDICGNIFVWKPALIRVSEGTGGMKDAFTDEFLKRRMR